jgi:RNA polymerase-binding transcription factor DksA
MELTIKVFSVKEWQKIQSSGDRAQRIAVAFEREINRAEVVVIFLRQKKIKLDVTAEEKHLHFLEERRNVFAISPNRYGHCDKCRKPIPIEELEKNPETFQCPDCLKQKV